MNDIYKFAAQHALRFPTVRGTLMVENLFQLPLTSDSGFDLDTIAKDVNAELKAAGEESFVTSKVDPRKRPLEVMLEILKDVIATKQAQAAALLKRQEKAAERRQILDAIGAKKGELLTASSLEDLEKKLEALEDE